MKGASLPVALTRVLFNRQDQEVSSIGRYRLLDEKTCTSGKLDKRERVEKQHELRKGAHHVSSCKNVSQHHQGDQERIQSLKSLG
jgi:hypothetical protein